MQRLDLRLSLRCDLVRSSDALISIEAFSKKIQRKRIEADKLQEGSRSYWTWETAVAYPEPGEDWVEDTILNISFN
jgi:hypothetical protein